MAKTPTEVKFALEFPQGLVLFMKDDFKPEEVGGVYFMPKKSNDAFMIYGERKELFGKNAITVSHNRQTGEKGYSLVYEFSESGALTDARLVSDKETLKGQMLDVFVTRDLNVSIAQDHLKLHSVRDTAPVLVSNVLRMENGQTLIQLGNDELYVGTQGNYTKLDAKPTMRGGSSLYYKAACGENIAIHGRDSYDASMFGDKELTHLNVKYGEDPAKLGLILPQKIKHLTPFSPEVYTSPGAAFKASSAPKAPGRP